MNSEQFVYFAQVQDRDGAIWHWCGAEGRSMWIPKGTKGVAYRADPDELNREIDGYYKKYHINPPTYYTFQTTRAYVHLIRLANNNKVQGLRL